MLLDSESSAVRPFSIGALLGDFRRLNVALSRAKAKLHLRRAEARLALGLRELSRADGRAPVPPSSHPRPMASSSIRTKRRRLARGVAAELGKRGVDTGAS